MASSREGPRERHAGRLRRATKMAGRPSTTTAGGPKRRRRARQDAISHVSSESLESTLALPSSPFAEIAAGRSALAIMVWSAQVSA